MLSIQRYYAVLILLGFILLVSICFYPENNHRAISKEQIIPAKNSSLAKFISNKLAYKSNDNPTILKINIPDHITNVNNILEIGEPNIHRVSLIIQDENSLKSYNWTKCYPSDKDNLSINPYFELNSKYLKSSTYLVYSESSLNQVPIKLYDINHFFNKQANQGIIKVVSIFILILVFTVVFYVHLKIKNAYTFLFTLYILLSLISNLLFNGFANNFWPFNIPYFADHILGNLLALHMSVMSYFLILLTRRSILSTRTIVLVNAIFVFSIIIFCLTFILNSYIMLSYIIFFIDILSCTFLFCYPSVFRKFKSKQAYKLNYYGIFLLSLVFSIHSLKYLSLINENFILDTTTRVLYLGHIIFMLGAFLLINKKKLIYIYSNSYQTVSHQLLDKSLQNSSEILATLTNREMEVLEFLAVGYSDKNLSEKLFVSIATVKTHKQRIYKKLGVNNKTQAIQIYLEFNAHSYEFINY